MDGWHRKFNSPEARLMLWVALCFALTSAVYLSWLYHLTALTDGAVADWISLVLGYLCQAAGLGLVCRALRGAPDLDRRKWFVAALALFGVTSAPALIGESAAGAAAFGLLMNLGCGAIAGFYLLAVAERGAAASVSRIFGGGYAAGTFAVGLMAVPGDGDLLRGPTALLICLPACAALAVAARRSACFGAPSEDRTAPGAPELPGRTLALACAAVLMASLVKNLGFDFPSADIAAGIRPELSRIPYGIGLMIAGFINDRNRKNGFICATAALATPFVMLSMLGEPVSRSILWGLNYLLFSFFTVTRAVLFIDLAQKTRRWALAPVGLMIGRLGDVAGSALGLLVDRRLALVLTTAVLFCATVFLMFRLYQRLYEPDTAGKKSEQEIYEMFCLHHDLSVRERDILRMLIGDRTNVEIAEELFISANTVKFHVRNILQKTGCKNRVELQKKYKLALYPQLGEAPELKLS